MSKSKLRRLTKDDWIVGARKLLINKSISYVKIEPLAKTLKVTPGSFYWHFSGRDELYDLLLKDWFNTNTTPLFQAVESAGADPKQQYLAFFGVWVLERDFAPEYDRAVRDWARTSPKVADALKEVDKKRIQLLKTIFENFGYKDVDAEMRARITYYHQVGYYAMFERESQEKRLQLAPFYAEVLTGFKWMHEFGTPSAIRAAMLGESSSNE